MPEQLSVATFSSSSDRKDKKIINALLHYPEGATPKMLAGKTGINVNTIKSILPKLPLVKKKLRGLYIVEKGGDGTIPTAKGELMDWNFHNCHLSTTILPSECHEQSHEMSLDLINLKFNISLKGRCTCSVATKYPINCSSIVLVSKLFRDWLEKFNIEKSNKDIMISTIEFNRDYSNVKMEGVKCVTVDSLTTQFKLYQKKIGLRVEHKTKVPMTVDNIIDMLTHSPSSLDVNVKLSETRSQLSRLTERTEKNTQLMWKMMDKINGKS